MRYYETRSSYEQSTFSNRLPLVTLLIIINAVIFITQVIFYILDISYTGIFALVPEKAIGRLWLWQFITHMFLHDTRIIFHIIFNMLMLYMFGRELEIVLGKTKFLIIYFACGLYAGLCYCIYQYISGGISYPAVGASGAIMGIIVIYALMWPNRIVWFFFIIPMKVWICVVILVAIDLLYTIKMLETGVANAAHLGGTFCGFAIYKLEPFIDGYFVRLEIGKARRIFSEEFGLRKKVDAILEKINKEGINSLTSKEKKLLEKASKKFARKG